MTTSETTPTNAAPAFTSWLDDFFTSFYRHRPVTATFAGVHDYDDRLPDYSDNGVGDALADTETLLKRLAALPPEPLTVEQRLDRQTAEGFLRTQQWEYDSPHFRWANPSVHTGEAIFGVIALLLREQTPLPERLDLVTARLDAIPTLLRQAQETLRPVSDAWRERALRESKAGRTLLGDGLEQYLAEHGQGESGEGVRPGDRARASLRAAADRAVGAFAAFERLLDDQERPTIDLYGCGAEAFGLLLRDAHFLDTDAAGLEARALDLMAGAEAALVSGAARFGGLDWQAALAALAEARPWEGDFYESFPRIWAESRAAARQHDLLTVPDWPVEWREQPAWIRAAASSLYFIPYRSPAPFGRPAGGIQYVPTVPIEAPSRQVQLFRTVNFQVIKQNYIVHHAGIGHHAQNWYAMQSASRIGQIAAVDGASRIAMLCGGTLAEGWASYVTDLMDEIGFLTPLESFAQQYAKLRMAARTVVDVRLHDGRFTLEDGQRFYEERVGMSASASYTEVVKNSLFSATGCMYLAGWDGIMRLRRAVEAREGSAFSRRRFHDRLLTYGSIPVALVAKTMLDPDSAD